MPLRTNVYRMLMSLPVRGAWVEIGREQVNIGARSSLPVRGAWVEMHSLRFFCALPQCRSPCGERGLKSLILYGRML